VFTLFEALVSKERCQKKEGETMKEKRQNGIGRKIKRREPIFILNVSDCVHHIIVYTEIANKIYCLPKFNIP
jgi:hypothetical protein